MLWMYLLAVVLLGVVVAALLGRWEGAAAPREESDLVASDVDDLLRRRADQNITADDLQEVRLDAAVRGYRMDQVDRLLDALGAQLHELQQAGSEPPTSAPRAGAESQGDRSETCIEPDLSPRRPGHDTPDKHLSLPSRADPKPGDPQVE